MTGSVAIHIAFSLQVSWGRGVGQPRWPPGSPSPPVSPQRLYYVKEAHGIVVTDLAFVPESRPGRELLGGHEAALLSVAVDSRCKLHLLPVRRTSWGLPEGLGHLCSSPGTGGYSLLSPVSVPQAPSLSGCCCCSVPGSSWPPSCCCSSPFQASCSPLGPGGTPWHQERPLILHLPHTDCEGHEGPSLAPPSPLALGEQMWVQGTTQGAVPVGLCWQQCTAGPGTGGSPAPGEEGPAGPPPCCCH